MCDICLCDYRIRYFYVILGDLLVNVMGNLSFGEVSFCFVFILLNFYYMFFLCCISYVFRFLW